MSSGAILSPLKSRFVELFDLTPFFGDSSSHSRTRSNVSRNGASGAISPARIRCALRVDMEIPISRAALTSEAASRIRPSLFMGAAVLASLFGQRNCRPNAYIVAAESMMLPRYSVHTSRFASANSDAVFRMLCGPELTVHVPSLCFTSDGGVLWSLFSGVFEQSNSTRKILPLPSTEAMHSARSAFSRTE